MPKYVTRFSILSLFALVTIVAFVVSQFPNANKKQDRNWHWYENASVIATKNLDGSWWGFDVPDTGTTTYVSLKWVFDRELGYIGIAFVLPQKVRQKDVFQLTPPIRDDRVETKVLQVGEFSAFDWHGGKPYYAHEASKVKLCECEILELDRLTVKLRIRLQYEGKESSIDLDRVVELMREPAVSRSK